MRGLRFPPIPSVLRGHLPSVRLASSSPHSISSNTMAQNTNESESLPPLSTRDFRIYNRMAEQMDMFHTHFRLTWNELQNACTTNKRSAISPRQLISMGESFVSHLTMHHNIEERHIFPVLAKKMPEFKKELDLLKQHKQIHAGLDKFEAYLSDCRLGRADLERGEVKRLMDGFGDVLWAHLDDEVRTLGAENMRRYWTLDEMPRLPM